MVVASNPVAVNSEILFHLLKSKLEIKGLTICDRCYLDSAYVDDTNFFLQDTTSIKHMTGFLRSFLDQKPKLPKFKIAGIGFLKGFKWQSVICVA